MSDFQSFTQIYKLLEIMKRLRAPRGCPWDREQTYLSLRRYIVEEAYELIEAVENEDISNMKEEGAEICFFRWCLFPV